MKSQKVNLVESVVAAVDLTRRRFVGFDGNVCANGVKALGEWLATVHGLDVTFIDIDNPV